MSEDEIPRIGKENPKSETTGLVFGVIVLVAVVGVAFWFGTKMGKVQAPERPCACECKMPQCPTCPTCPSQFLVMDETSLKPIKQTKCRCEAWVVGDCTARCSVIKPGDVPSGANVVCEEN